MTWFWCSVVAMVAWGSVGVCVKTTVVSVAQPTSSPTSTASALAGVTASCRFLTLSCTPCTVVPRRSCPTSRPAISASQVNMALHSLPRVSTRLYYQLIKHNTNQPACGKRLTEFSRAMLCRNAPIAVMRCLSVRLSVTFVDHHVKTNKHILEIFSPSGSHTILVFPYQTGLRYSYWGRRMQKSRFWSNSWLWKIAGRAKCQKHLPTTKLSIWHSRPRTTGYRSIAGRVNYEVTKTVTDDHAV